MVFPTIEVFRMSLYKWGGFSNTQTLVGLDNCKILWNDTKFIQSFQNSILLIVLVAIFTMVFAVFFAAILTREELFGQSVFGIIFCIPSILLFVVSDGFFLEIFSL